MKPLESYILYVMCYKTSFVFWDYLYFVATYSPVTAQLTAIFGEDNV